MFQTLIESVNSVVRQAIMLLQINGFNFVERKTKFKQQGQEIFQLALAIAIEDLPKHFDWCVWIITDSDLDFPVDFKGPNSNVREAKLVGFLEAVCHLRLVAGIVDSEHLRTQLRNYWNANPTKELADTATMNQVFAQFVDTGGLPLETPRSFAALMEKFDREFRQHRALAAVA